jgi:hypothetical protein
MGHGDLRPQTWDQSQRESRGVRESQMGIAASGCGPEYDRH